LHLGAGGQAHFHADDAGAAFDFAAADFPLHLVGVVEIHVRIIVGDLGDVVRLQLRLFDLVGKLFNLFACQAHCAPPAAWVSVPRCCLSMSSATSTIMSSCPPTMRRRPSSTRMSTVFRPYFCAATSAWRRKLEYTPA